MSMGDWHTGKERSRVGWWSADGWEYVYGAEFNYSLLTYLIMPSMKYYTK